LILSGANPVKYSRKINLLWMLLLLLGSGLRPAHAQDTVRDVLLITPTTQGVFRLPNTGVVIEIGYATVNDAAHLSITRSDAARYTITATDANDRPLARFEMPLIVTLPEENTPPVLVGWPGDITPETVADSAEAPDVGRWLVVFDAHGLYALPAWTPAPEQAIYLGPLEHYTPALIQHDLDWGPIRYTPARPIERSILRIETHAGQTTTTPLPTAARTDHYRDRFIPEDLRNPGGFMLLGWVRAPDLPDLVRALRATIPADPDLPAPGVPATPIPLLLPFDCAQDWAVSWGYHHSTPQNRFAVDFAPLAPGSAGVYAAHAGTLYLKRYGTADQLIDVGLAARVIAADGITSTLYGHLEPSSTLALWDAGSLPDFEWIEIGPVDQGRLIGVMGRSGYATGPHVHFALWSWDQSLYQPVPLGPLTHFERGVTIPAGPREGCDRYRR
jgi:murein DD-endopeptidase MepM/ murein hydrolase activator NlpD